MADTNTLTAVDVLDRIVDEFTPERHAKGHVGRPDTEMCMFGWIAYASGIPTEEDGSFGAAWMQPEGVRAEVETIVAATIAPDETPSGWAATRYILCDYNNNHASGEIHDTFRRARDLAKGRA